ncbi:F-box/FBD/LRR-repeat protein At1g13570 [Linum perenne]
MASDTVYEEHRAEKRSRQDDLVDRISNLPDEILVNILSLLSFSEALGTSVLSSRWIHLWKSAVTELDFEGFKLLEEKPVLWPIEPVEYEWTFLVEVPNTPPKKSPIVVKKKLMYMNSVNRVLRQINVLKIKKFRVSFNLNRENNSEGDIDRWIEFAMSKRVEYLELSLGVMGFFDGPPGGYSLSQGCYDYIKTPAGLSNIKHLRSLHLSYVDIEEENIEYLIMNCPLLEDLAVDNAKSLHNLRIEGSPSSSSPLALKYLEVRPYYSELLSMEIDHAPNLTRLVYRGQWMESRVLNCESLVDVDISLTDHYEASGVVFNCLAAYIGQLESLSMVIDHSDLPFRHLAELASLASLEQLKIHIVGAKSDYSILGLVPLINACPRLHTLRVELSVVYNPDASDDNDEEIEAVEKVCRESIKVVEIIDFNGYDLEYEFVEYVLEYFTGLERIVIEREVWKSKCLQLRPEAMEIYQMNLENTEKCALELKSLAPPGVEFVII